MATQAPDLVTCTYCGGDGMHGSHRDDGPCANCQGTGKVPRGHRDPDGTIADTPPRRDPPPAPPPAPAHSAAMAATKRDEAVTEAAIAFRDLCKVGTEALELWVAFNRPRRLEHETKPPEPWRCPECGARPTRLSAEGVDPPVYGCQRTHGPVIAPEGAKLS